MCSEVLAYLNLLSSVFYLYTVSPLELWHVRISQAPYEEDFKAARQTHFIQLCHGDVAVSSSTKGEMPEYAMAT